MLLQITNTESIDSLSTIGSDNDNTGLFLIIGLILIGLIAYFILRPKKTGEIENKPIESRNQNSRQKVIVTEKSKERKVDVSEHQTETKSKELHQTTDAATKEKEQANKTKQTNNEITPPIKKKEVVIPEKEEQSKEKYIGYNPINIFAQTEPLNYPYVLMPKPNSVIKFPRKGRSGRKGFKEEEFKTYVVKYFKGHYQVFDDRFILVKNSHSPYEPDFTLIDEREGINIFLDVEIDEPYEGLNDIQKRKPTHFQNSDINRNNAFKNRGWIVIRFAEIQVHQEPDSCCRFIADVLKSINPKYNIPESLVKYSKIKSVRQWTKEEAELWSIEKYREKYLGIAAFGLTENGQLLPDIEETELGDKIEEQVKDDKFIPDEIKTRTPIAKLEKIYSAINSNKYLSFSTNNEKTVVKPIIATKSELIAFCYIKNRERTFAIYEIKDIQIKDSYYTLRVAGPTIGIERIKNAVNTAINYHKLIRMKYTRSAWSSMLVDQETGELIVNNIEAEESIRTINDVQMSINALAQEHIEQYNLNENYISAYCNKREEQRTFRFDRIGEIEILDL
ncbi:MAG: hypothetical protein R2821_10530 [Flavobacteriaceae bacterium]